MRTAEKPRAVLPGGVTSLCRTADGRGLIAGTEAGRIARCAPASLPSPYLVLARPLLPSSSRYCPHLHARAGWRPAPWRSPSSQSATSEPCAASRTAATTSPPARLAARQGVTAVNISHEGRFLVTGAPGRSSHVGVGISVTAGGARGTGRGARRAPARCCQPSALAETETTNCSAPPSLTPPPYSGRRTEWRRAHLHHLGCIC
mmetsp:Transcript_39217/g.99353  ORF Transcript_39217/g.99353 Transcript_39217/m.99353 type:complete len:204 (-) Transcript_39217:486-1097(-)